MQIMIGAIRVFPFSVRGLLLSALSIGLLSHAENLVENGNFEGGVTPEGAPVGWKTAGIREIEQKLEVRSLPEGGHAAVLSCTRFVGGSPASHAMMAQTGVVEIRKGQWYRIRWRARAEDLKARSVSIAVRDTQTWGDSGITLSFSPQPGWRSYERLLQARQDVPKEHSRLQIWFQGTGRLWMDDVAIEPAAVDSHPVPVVAPGDGANLVPNAGFECGRAGWGAFAPDIWSWGNMFRLPPNAGLDTSNPAEGQACLRLALPLPRTERRFYFDYFDPLAKDIRVWVAGNRGWIPVKPSSPYVLSCRVRADDEDTPVLLYMRESSGRSRSRKVTAGPSWRRVSAVFRPRSRYVWIGVGPDLRESKRNECRVWIDAVQFAAGETVRAYGPRSTIEVFLEQPRNGGYVLPDTDVAVDVRVCNAGKTERVLPLRLRVIDFYGRNAGRFPLRITVPAKSGRTVRKVVLPRVEPGWYRVYLEAPEKATAVHQSVRIAAFVPYSGPDSVLGVNHAYPWNYLLDRMAAVGIRWVRDWSVKWHAVQSGPGAPFDFAVPDVQLNRVLDRGLQTLILFPFPSAPWCSEADPAKISQAVGKRKYLERRYVVACAARDRSLFKTYVTESVRHYAGRVRVYEVLNEPVYTTYALPQRFGYSVKDYVEHLRLAYEAVHSVRRDAVVIGGIAAWADSARQKELIAAGGLQWVDALNLHLYPNTVDPVLYQADLERLRQDMKRAGRVVPIWVTEFGCYADDDPDWFPPRPAGDATMQRSLWPDERAAAEALAKTAAVFLSHGVEKIFLHAGTSGVWNGRDANGVLFEYGAAPRKVAVTANVLARLLGGRPRALQSAPADAGVWYALFRVREGFVLTAWSRSGEKIETTLLPGIEAVDVQGRTIHGPRLSLGESPVFFCGRDKAAMVTMMKELAGRAAP